MNIEQLDKKLAELQERVEKMRKELEAFDPRYEQVAEVYGPPMMRNSQSTIEVSEDEFVPEEEVPVLVYGPGPFSEEG